MPQPVWTLTRLHLGAQSSRLNDISLEIGSGCTAILGCSGAGKSSLLSVLARFEPPTSGSVQFQPAPTDGQIPLFWSPQDHALWPHLTAEEHLDHVRPDKPKIDRDAQQWLAAVDLADLATVRPDRMSQGERSRLSLVRTLASEAWTMLFDEPLVHVGTTHAADCWRLIHETSSQLGGPLVYSTHDPESVLRFADDVVCLDAGRVIYSGPVATLQFNPPDQASAGLLGPFNWISPDDPSLPNSLCRNWPQCVRPFELCVTADSAGEFRVVDVKQIAGQLELTLHCIETQAESRIVTTATPGAPQTDERVRIAFHPAPARPDADSV